MTQVHCYNKGCGQTFDPEKNTDGSCTYHPGVPVFHDALKGWSCCDKRSTDFTQFLNYPGCTQGRHSNDKPVEPEKPKREQTEVVVEKPKPREPIKPRDTQSRPSVEEPRIKLKSTVGASLKSALEKLSLESPVDQEAEGDASDGTIKIGESCKNNSCKASYQGESSDTEDCAYHPGVPIFHEGMKYWSCCQKKTSDFDNFLAQVGCETGKHKWIKPQSGEGEMKSCRFDWHQTGPLVCLSIFAKTAMPELSLVEANQVSVKAHIVFDGGKSVFEKEIVLCDTIVPDQSQVKLLGTKVEINLRKAEAFKWPTLELPPSKPAL